MREHFNRWYKLHSFYLANKIADFPIQFIAICLYILIVYYMSDQLLELQRFCLYTLMCFAVSMVAQTFGLLIGTGMKVQVWRGNSYLLLEEKKKKNAFLFYRIYVSAWHDLRTAHDPSVSDIQRILCSVQRRSSVPAMAVPFIISQIWFRGCNDRYLRVK